MIRGGAVVNGSALALCSPEHPLSSGYQPHQASQSGSCSRQYGSGSPSERQPDQALSPMPSLQFSASIESATQLTAGGNGKAGPVAGHLRFVHLVNAPLLRSRL